MQKLHLASKSQPQGNDQDQSSQVNHAAESELADDAVQVPKLSILAELEDDTGEGLLDEDSDKTEEL